MAADPTVTPRRVSQRELTVLVRDVVAARPNRTVWIGIDGFGGAGKTRLAVALASSIGDAPVVHVDDFAGPAVPEWDWPRMQKELVDPLLAGSHARYQRWEWNCDEPAESAGQIIELEQRHDCIPIQPGCHAGGSGRARGLRCPPARTSRSR